MSMHAACGILTAKQKINSEFRKNLAESSPEKITQLLKLGSDVEVVLRTSVIQGVHIDHNKILLRPTKEVLQDNAPFHDTPRKDT
uniref:LYR motif-containing protein 7 n=1 Tax=Callorhinchus milii TaxID=7868 RepID=A0A4W3H4F1_CALMI|eukprot:gi/632950423/ref/XP_007890717.1/ PREDICTED: complex III assembly factor LYRM7 isoform X2 [Callorhinchus milii]